MQHPQPNSVLQAMTTRLRSRSKLLKLNSEHIRFVMDRLKQNTQRVRNIRQYLLTALFNAPSTMSSYYAALVAHDMAA